MRSLMRNASLSVLALGLAGCVTTPPPQAITQADVPPAFTAPRTADAANAPIWPVAGWWSGFNAPELPPLEQTAQTQNLDIQAAAARVLQAQANTNIALSTLFPTLNGTGQAQRSGSNGGSTTVNGVTIPGGGARNSFGIGAQASYEVDLWGVNRNQLSAAEHSELASRYAMQTVALTTTADVANTYLDVLALRQRLTIAHNNVEAARRILTITQARVTNGVASNLELSQQRSLLAGVEASIPPLEEQEREARYALAILLGRAPEGFDVRAKNLDGIISPPVKGGVPSTLLERRPDVAQAEEQLLAAHANLDSARAAFFPQITLSAGVTQLFDPSSLAWNIGASLLQSIFDGGRLSAQSDLARAQQTELVATYRKAVFSAFSDTETAMGQVYAFGQQEALLRTQVTAAAEAYRISELQYREGVIDLLTVLQTQQTLFQAQDNLVQVRLARLQADVGLFRALGGGWTVATDPNAPPPTDDPTRLFPIVKAITEGG